MRTASKFALLLITCACSVPLHAQTQYSGSVSGHVYCADTNAPARFARVQLIPVRTGDVGEVGRPSQSPDTTGLDGSFRIQNVAPGTYHVVAVLFGYLNPLSQVTMDDLTSADPAAQERVARVLTTVSVNGSDGAHAEIRLEHGASLSGTVSYDDGSPAINIVVTAKPATGNEAMIGYAQTGAGQFARTDDYGRYHISGLPPGDYVVMATSQLQFGDFNGGGREAQSNTLIIYAPRNFHMGDAKIFTLNTRSELNGADVLIPLAAFHAVSGSVESSDGHTLNAGTLTLTDDKDKTHSFHTNVASDGQFRFLYVTEGSYTLSLTGAAITAPDTTAGNNRGRPRTTVVQAYGNATQSVLVEDGDLSVVVQAPPLTQASTSPTP